MSADPVIEALRKALAQDPENAPLWEHLAGLLAQGGAAHEAAEAYRRVLELRPQHRPAAARYVAQLRLGGKLAEALLRAEHLLATHDDPALRLEIARIQLARGSHDEALQSYRTARSADPALQDEELENLARAAPQPIAPAGAPDGEPALAAVHEPRASEAEWAAQFDWGDLRVTLADVVGLEAVKKQVRLRVLAPQQHPELYRAFARKGGGGILLYGPPGCGKTFLARATAGEMGARFLGVGIHEIVDKYWGESEKLVHALFADARRRSPTVLFFDEFDALGASRGRSDSQFWKSLSNQLLQEMDGFASQNENVLVFAATNMPWSVDPAFRRPGRFDRLFFVPPPDLPARIELLRRNAAQLPGGASLSLEGIARKAELFTAADLKALCERAAEPALEKSLETGRVHPVTALDFERELKRMQSSALEWLATARNHARYANEAGIYDDVVEFLKQIKRW